jgi:hypothetical protein
VAATHILAAETHTWKRPKGLIFNWMRLNDNLG